MIVLSRREVANFRFQSFVCRGSSVYRGSIPALDMLYFVGGRWAF